MGSSIISGIMAISMMLTAVCGGFGGTKAAQPMTVEVSVGLDGEIPEGIISGTTPEMAAGLVELINILSIGFSVDSTAAQMQINLADSPVASLGVKDNGDSWQAVSDLFPGTVLTLTKEEADALTQQLFASTIPADTSSAPSSLTDVLAKLDVEAITPVFEAKFAELAAAFEEKFSEPEAGEYLVGEKTYTKKSVLNMTSKEAATLAVTAVKDLLANEAISSLIASLGGIVNMESIEETLTNIANTTDEDAPDLSVARYLDDAGDSCVAVVVSKKDQMDVYVTVADTSAEVDVDLSLVAGDQGGATGSVAVDKASGNAAFSLDIVSPQAALSLAGSVIAVKGGIGVLLGLTIPVPGAEEPVTFSLSAAVTDEAPTVAVPADAETIAIAEMQQSEEIAQTFNSKIMVGLMTVLGNVMTATADMPEVQQIFTSLLTGMTSGSGSTTPATEPAVVEEAPAAP